MHNQDWINFSKPHVGQLPVLVLLLAWAMASQGLCAGITQITSRKGELLMKSTMRTSMQLGRVSTIKAKGAEVHVLRSDEFESCVRERGAVQIENGKEFRFATYEEGGSRTLLIGNHTSPNKDEINQDF